MRFLFIFFILLLTGINAFSQTNNAPGNAQPQINNQQRQNPQASPVQQTPTTPQTTQAQPAQTSQSPDIQEEDTRQRIVPEVTKLEDYLKRDSDKNFEFSLRVILGNLSMEKIPFLYGRIQPAIKYKQFSLALDLNLEVIAEDKDRTPYAAYKAGQVRKDEWQQLRAYPNKILFLTFGDRYDYPVFVHIGRITDYSLGNSFLVHRYNNTLYSPDITRTGAEFKVDFKVAGVEGFTSDVTDFNVFGGRVFLRPFGLTDFNTSIIGMIEIGFTFAMDRNLSNYKRFGDRTYVSNEINGESLKAYSFDVYLPVFKSKVISLGAYASITKILDYNHGYQLGIKGDIAEGVLFYRVEGRLMWRRFIGPIFNSQWDVQKRLTYFGPNNNLSYIDNLNIDETGGSFFIEIKNMWLKRKIGFFISCEMYIMGRTKLKPHLQLGFFMKRGVLSDRFALRFIVDKVNLSGSNAGKLSELDTIFTIEASVMVATNIDFVFKYMKAYTENPAGAIIGNELIMLETRLTF